MHPTPYERLIRTLTFKDLKKRLNLGLSYKHTLFDRLNNKPFWIWDAEEHKKQDAKTNGDCCFNHIIGPPRKETIEKPSFDHCRFVSEEAKTSHRRDNSGRCGTSTLSAALNMKPCQNCAIFMGEDSQFCGNCGEKF